MSETYLIGSGATSVGEHYQRSALDLASEALRGALGTLDPQQIGAIYVAGALGEALGGQSQLGAALAGMCGLAGIEAVRIEAAGASGGAALHQARLALRSGAHQVVVVLGIEKTTDRLDPAIEAALALATDPFEAEQGVTLTAQWAMLMRRYMHQYRHGLEAFAPFPVNAHANAVKNPLALYRFPINADKYAKAPPIAAPLNMLDCASLADGAAALILANESIARELPGPHLRLLSTAIATDRLALGARRNPLDLAASRQSAQTALAQAQLDLAAVDLFELTDPHGIAAILALEAIGLYEPGSAPAHAADGAITPQGKTPLATAGGYKARGDLAGATGVYQIVEIIRQLRGEAGPSQVAEARVGLAQVLGGVGATAVTSIISLT